MTDNARNIIIFCDGTWNSPEEESFGLPVPTNVHKLYMSCLDQAESNGKQITWYQPGVGSGSGAMRRAFDGATGTGIGMNIRRAYSAIAAHYRGPEDRIFLIGFSRGAFAARSVAGMIESVGLLKNPTREAVDAAYGRYQNDSTDFSREAKDSVHEDVRIYAIGVWDTVGSLGISMWGWSFNFQMIWRNHFHKLSPNSITDHVFHALALDEKRTSFVPSLWQKPSPGHAPIVEETWFRGVHSDIGGGYADSRLSDISLDWMCEKLKSAGMLLRGSMPQLKPDVTGRIHNSARGPLWTNVPTWPRWTPLYTRSERSGSSATHSCLHESVKLREDSIAAAGIFEFRRQRLRIGEKACIAIRARTQWEYTGIILEPGASYELTAEGVWQDWTETPVGPEGQPEEQESWIKRCFRWIRRLPDARWFELIALASHDRGLQWKELGMLQFLKCLILRDPIEFTSQLVRVGRGCTISNTSIHDAMLWCFANDAWKFYENNTGSIVLQVLRRN